MDMESDKKTEMKNIMGRVPKHERNMELCKMVDEKDGVLTRKQIADHFQIDRSNLTHLVDRWWPEYVRNKKQNEKLNS